TLTRAIALREEVFRRDVRGRALAANAGDARFLRTARQRAHVGAVEVVCAVRQREAMSLAGERARRAGLAQLTGFLLLSTSSSIRIWSGSSTTSAGFVAVVIVTVTVPSPGSTRCVTSPARTSTG